MAPLGVIPPKFFSGKRILITGNTGFKGSWLTLLLQDLGAETYGVSLPPENDGIFSKALKAESKRTKFLDIKDFSALLAAIEAINPDATIHLAAQPLVISSYKNPLDTFETNVLGTANLLESFRVLNKQNHPLLIVTTDKVYRESQSNTSYCEGDELFGHDPYSLSKVGSELVVEAWRNSGMTNIISARSGNVIGGGDVSPNRLVPDIIKSVIHKKPLIVRNIQSIRPWQHVLDPLYGYLLALHKIMTTNDMPPALNFGPPNKSSYTVRDVIEIFEDLLSTRINYSIDESLEFRENPTLNLNSTLAKETLGWYNRLGFRDMLAWTLDWEIHSIQANANEISKLQISKYFELLK